MDRRQFLGFGGLLAASAALGCDRLSPLLLADAAPPGDPFAVPGGTVRDALTHVLSRLTYGPRPGEWERVSRLGRTPDQAVAAFIEQQLHPDAIADEAAERGLPLDLLGLPVGEFYEYKPPLLLEALARATLLRAVRSERQLHAVMVEFWSDHFNIDVTKGDCRWLKAADDRDVIRRHAMGSFRELLRASALSPAMLWYLDGRVNQRAEPAERANENYARELLELHTLGVHGGYTQQDVMEVARALTGWTVRSKGDSVFGIGKVEFHPELHDDGEKWILGQRLGPGLGPRDLDAVLDIACRHPATAQHLASRLCRRFIDDEPPRAAVQDVAAAFAASGGSVPATLRTLFATEAFRSAPPRRLKRPFHLVVSALRATGASTDGGPALQAYLQRMGQAPFQCPTPDGYPDEPGPWLGTLLWRWNFAAALAHDRIAGTRVDVDLLRRRAGGDRGLAAHLLGRQPLPDESRLIAQAADPLTVLIASPDFQRY